MKFLNQEGVVLLWSKIKAYVSKSVSDNVSEKLGQPDGIASLDSTGKLNSSQLPSLKTINGQTVVGTGDITIDLSIYKIVEVLPEISTADPNKIYLVLSSTSGEQNLYTEFAKINNAWEKLGEYKAEVELDDYLKTADLKEEGKKAGLVTFDDVATASKNGLVTGDDKKLLDAIITNRISPSSNFRHNTDSNVANVVTITYDKITVEDDEGIQIYKSNGSFEINAATSTKPGIMTAAEFNKLEAIEAQATKDEAITTTELEAILV